MIRLDELVRRQAARTPDAPALREATTVTSYGDLIQRAQLVARQLQRRSIGRNDLVAVCMDRCAAQIVGTLGVLTAGAAYVPIDPHGPAERRRFIFEDSEPRAIVTNAAGIGSIPTHLRPIVVSTDAPADNEGGDAAEADTQLSDHSPRDVAYVIYTSGSTGVPKGVLNQHDGIANHLAWMASTFPLGTCDRVLAKTPALFDVSVWEWFWPLSQGACLVLTRPGDERDPSRIVSAIESNDITNVHFVPTMLRVLLDRQDLTRCGSLKRVICSGEALTAELRDRFFERLPGPPALINLYGPTETGVHVTGWVCAPHERGAVPIGLPLANVRAYIVDSDLKPVPPGVRGELLIGGIQVARGYLRRPELTAERFVRDPFVDDSDARCYRTGDSTSWRADGAIEFFGRSDSQVQIGGARVELGEVEAALRCHPAVGDAVVVVQGEHAAARLIAYLRRARRNEGWNDPSVESLRAALADALPTYMLPTRYVWLDDFPLTATGKLDRRALPKPDGTRQSLEQPFEAPRPGTEARLAEIWGAELKVDGVGRRDEFHLLGGDSLSAIRIVEEIAHQFGVEMSADEFLQTPTLALMADRIERGKSLGSTTSIVTLRAGDGPDPLFLPPSMHGQLLHWHDLIGALRPGRPVYGFTLPPREGPVEFRALAATLVRDLIAFQPEGPYHLAGYSFSAGLALEMAQQLRALGRTVGILAMIDYGPGSPDGWWARIRTIGHFIDNLPDWWRYDILQSDWSAVSARIRRKLTTLNVRMSGAPSPMRRTERVVDEIFGNEPLSASKRRLVVEHLHCFFEYQPTRYDGQVLLFRARCRPLLHSLAPTLGWEHYARDFTRVLIACNHNNILKPPHVRAVASGLDDAFDRFSATRAAELAQARAEVSSAPRRR